MSTTYAGDNEVDTLQHFCNLKMSLEELSEKTRQQKRVLRVSQNAARDCWKEYLDSMNVSCVEVGGSGLSGATAKKRKRAKGDSAPDKTYVRGIKRTVCSTINEKVLQAATHLTNAEKQQLLTQLQNDQIKEASAFLFEKVKQIVRKTKTYVVLTKSRPRNATVILLSEQKVPATLKEATTTWQQTVEKIKLIDEETKVERTEGNKKLQGMQPAVSTFLQKHDPDNRKQAVIVIEDGKECRKIVREHESKTYQPVHLTDMTAVIDNALLKIKAHLPDKPDTLANVLLETTLEEFQAYKNAQKLVTTKIISLDDPRERTKKTSSTDEKDGESNSSDSDKQAT